MHQSANCGYKRRTSAALSVVVLLCACSISAAWATGKTHVVVIENMVFTPAIIEVAQGDTVLWKNKDVFPHTATAENRKFDSRNISANRSWKFKARKKGSFAYICSLHPTMKGTLVVK